MKTKIISIIFCIILISTTISVAENINRDTNQENNNLTISSNGLILDQDLDQNGKGYTVMRLWGSYYEMGYAQAELIGDYIVDTIDQNKAYIGSNYNNMREIIADTIWMPVEIEDEFNGIVDCLAISHPSANIDSLDLKILNTIGDWAYACRSHSCWGRYVQDPIKTISTRRLDYFIPYDAGYHHVIIARSPNDGSLRWVNMGWPGLCTAVTGVNEFGTLVSLHDYHSSNSDFSADRMARMVACRYALTYAYDPDLSTHLQSTYEELQNYEIMTGSFVNYYAPEGNGGVMTCHPGQSGPDFYDLRTPKTEWHHGEAMITTNAQTDGTYTPSDEDFGADNYYNDEGPKTISSHWNLLRVPGYGNWKNAHLFTVAYKNREDMTIWTEGRLGWLGEKTSRIELEWTDLFDPEKPTSPKISGPTNCKPGIEYDYTFVSYDPNDDAIFYWIEWSPITKNEWIGPYESGEEITISITWPDEGAFEIRAKAKNQLGMESNFGTLTINVDKSRSINRIFDIYPLLRYFLRFIY